MPREAATTPARPPILLKLYPHPAFCKAAATSDSTLAGARFKKEKSLKAGGGVDCESGGEGKEMGTAGDLEANDGAADSPVPSFPGEGGAFSHSWGGGSQRGERATAP